MTPKQALKFLIKEHVKQLLEAPPTIRGADGKLRSPRSEADWEEVRRDQAAAKAAIVPGTYMSQDEIDASWLRNERGGRAPARRGSEEKEPPAATSIVSKPPPSKAEKEAEKDKQDAVRREEQRSWDEENGLNGYGSVGGNMRSAAARV